MMPTTGLQRPNLTLRGFRVIPKAELHCHLEGLRAAALARRAAARNGLDLPSGLFADDGHYAWRDFLSFLDSYDRVCGVLRKSRDFGDILYSYLERTAAEGAVYVEMFCSPERPKALGIPYAEWVGALADAIDRARRDFGIEARIIAICIRHLGPSARWRLPSRWWPSRIRTSWRSAWAATRGSSVRPILPRPIGWPTIRATAAPSMRARSAARKASGPRSATCR
jgi:hypothetical protein